MHIIHRVALDNQDRIHKVEWQKVDPAANAWVGGPKVVDVIEVVDDIKCGGIVYMSVPGGPGNGPYVMTFADQAGNEWIKVNPKNGETRSLQDLPRL